MPTITERLRQAGNKRHDALEATAFGLALQSEAPPLPCYVWQLHAYATVHAALDGELAGSADPIVAAVWHLDLAKLALLERDLASLDGIVAPPPAATLDAAGRFAGDIYDAATAEPVALLGFLYVMEGSTLGAAYLLPNLESGLGLDPGVGLSYYGCAAGDRSRWVGFTERLNRAVTLPASQASVLSGADTAYAHIGRIVATLSADLGATSGDRVQ